MRVPHTVPANTLQAYKPSSQTLCLVAERTRRLRAEDFAWDVGTPPTLVEMCIQFFVSDFTEYKKVISFLEEDNLILLLETLPTDLPLEIVIPLIQDGVYWMRRCQDTWNINNDVSMYDNSWKRMFTERYVQDLVENEEPGYTDWAEVGKHLKLCCPFVKRLEISQLQPPRVLEPIPAPPDLCSAEDFVPQHLDLSPILIILENLEEISIQFGVKNIGMDFTFKCFRIHPKDVERLGMGLAKSKNLIVLKISCSDIDDSKLVVILKGLEECPQFRELELAHCKISDAGAKALGHFISIKTSLKHLKLQNNFIRTEGARGLAHALTLEETKLETLDVKFNLIGEEGGQYFATALAKSMHPQHLILSGCGLGKISGRDITQMLVVNDYLLTLDISNNDLGNEVGEIMAKALERNYSILKVDVRNCGLSEECENVIHFLTLRNREKVRRLSWMQESKKFRMKSKPPLFVGRRRTPKTL